LGNWEAAAAFYAVRGILPSTFLRLPLTEKIFLHAAMEQDFKLEMRKLAAMVSRK